MAQAASALFAIARATAGRAARTTARTFGVLPAYGRRAGTAAVATLKRLLPVVVVFLGLVTADQALAIDQIVRLTGSGYYSGNFKINAGPSVAFNQSTSAATAQASFDTNYGAGKVVVTKPAANDYRIEFIGWPDTAVTYSWTMTSDPEFGSSAASLHQAAEAEEPPPEEPPPEEEDDRTEAELLQSIDAALVRVVEELETQQADVLEQTDKLLFLLEANAVAVCMIWGAYFWRMLILAKNQSRIF